jgi:AraC family transcriptional regulator
VRAPARDAPDVQLCDSIHCPEIHHVMIRTAPSDDRPLEHSPERRAHGLTLRLYRYGADHYLPRHEHARAYFTVVTAGGFDEREGRRTRTCTRGDLVFHPEGEVHTDRFHRDGGHVLRVEMAAPFLSRLREHGPILTQPVVLNDGATGWLGSRLHREFVSRDACSDLAIEGLALELLVAAQRDTISPRRAWPTWLDRVEDHLRARFAEPIALQAVAHDVHVHPSHVARAFRARHHCSIGAFVRRLRIEHACRRLLDPATDLAALSIDLGFVDQSHFSRVFKRHVGLTPSEFRRRS